jgi:hypothetical protein
LSIFANHCNKVFAHGTIAIALKASIPTHFNIASSLIPVGTDLFSLTSIHSATHSQIFKTSNIHFHTSLAVQAIVKRTHLYKFFSS